MTLLKTTPFLPSAGGRLRQVDLLSGTWREVINTDLYEGGGPSTIAVSNWTPWTDEHGEVPKGRMAFLQLEAVIASTTKLNAADRARLMGLRPQHAHRHRCKGGPIRLERVQQMIDRWNGLVRGELSMDVLRALESREKFRQSWGRLLRWNRPEVLPQLHLVDGRLSVLDSAALAALATAA